MADPTFNLKTGADSDLFYAREVTAKGSDLGKIKTVDGLYRYPVLTRSTGNSIKGSTESIESNELRKGRTKSAPKKGNSSAEGDLNIELSPLTYDDMFEAAFRNKWKRWSSDTNSESNKQDSTGTKKIFAPGYFATACGKKGSKALLRTSGDDNMDDDSVGLILVPEGCIVDEITCGTEDIKYSMLRKFGGTTDEDIYQEFNHMGVNTMSLNVPVGEIVTGSFGFMGANDPEMMDVNGIKENFGADSKRFLDGVTTGESYIKNLPEATTQTDQFTAREGFLYINGRKIEFATSLDMEINNGLEKKFAIFVKNAISQTPLELDITGTIETYLVKDGSDKIFNEAVKDVDNEILFCLQDKEKDPQYLYVFQIFKSKFTDHDASINGADTLSVSFPFQSFGEQAIRVFRIALPQVVTVQAPYTPEAESVEKLVVTPNIELSAADVTDLSIEVKIGDETQTLGTFEVIETESDVNYKKVVTSFDTPIGRDVDKTLDVKVSWKGIITNYSIFIEKKV